MVHFGSVAVLHTLFAKQPLHLSVPLVAIVAGGFSMVAAAGLTVDPHPQYRFYTILHIFTIYGIFLIRSGLPSTSRETAANNFRPGPSVIVTAPSATTVTKYLKIRAAQ